MATEVVQSRVARIASRRQRGEPLAALSLGALGVVFGDIGTSPLYAFQQCFTGDFAAAANPQNVLGLLSLIFWSLLIVVWIKYVGFMLRADFDGQGGTLALLAQLLPPKRAAAPTGLGALVLLVLFGSSMLYGDGAITPAISVISAIEGIGVWTSAAQPLIVPLSIVILVGLFVAQRRGTGRIGALFGPIMLLWFVAIAVLGLRSITQHPGVFAALSPVYGIAFFVHNGPRSLLVFGAVVLCVTGAEALYADLAHFGRVPIARAWVLIVLPALLLNYFGQGALLLRDPHALASSMFYAMAPRWALVPMVLLSTVATVIASQALISGVFSLTQQAIQLGYSPRFRIVHTSRHFAGQIYMPTINAVLGVACVLLVLSFGSSERLGGAYGLAVTITMLTTTIAFAYLLHKRWKWPAWQWIPLIALFGGWELAFLIGNASKFIAGGWVPVAMALALFVLFTTWNRGRRRMMAGLTEHTLPVEQLLREAKDPNVISGTAVFLTPDPRGIPCVLRHKWVREHIIFDTVVLLTIMHASRPFVHHADMVEIENVSARFMRVKAWYGFMQEPNVREILTHLRAQRPTTDFSNPTYYLARPAIRDDTSPRALPNWQRHLFRWMTRNARPLTDSLGLPPSSTVEFGVEVRV